MKNSNSIKHIFRIWFWSNNMSTTWEDEESLVYVNQIFLLFTFTSVFIPVMPQGILSITSQLDFLPLYWVEPKESLNFPTIILIQFQAKSELKSNGNTNFIDAASTSGEIKVDLETAKMLIICSWTNMSCCSNKKSIRKDKEDHQTRICIPKYMYIKSSQVKVEDNKQIHSAHSLTHSLTHSFSFLFILCCRNNVSLNLGRHLFFLPLDSLMYRSLLWIRNKAMTNMTWWWWRSDSFFHVCHSTCLFKSSMWVTHWLN